MRSPNDIAFSSMSRTTDLGDSSASSSHGLVRRYAMNAGSRRSASGRGPRDLVEQVHALLVLDAVGLHRGDRLASRLILLRDEDLARVRQGRLDHGDHVERVVGRLDVEQVHRGEREGGQRLVESEAARHVDREAQRRPLAAGVRRIGHPHAAPPRPRCAATGQS